MNLHELLESDEATVRYIVSDGGQRNAYRLGERIGHDKVVRCAVCWRGINASKPGTYHCVQTDRDGNMPPVGEPTVEYIGPICWNKWRQHLEPHEIDRPATPYGR